MKGSLNFQPVLITGEMRSGTTFLANLLNTQAEAAVYADMLVQLFMSAQQMGVTDIDQELTDREKNVLFSNLIQEGKVFRIDFSGIDRRKTNTWWDIFSQALLVLNRENRKICGIKRTREAQYINALLQKGAKVIYCLRDPRDVLLSSMNRFSDIKIHKVVDNWKKNVSLAREWDEHAGFLMVRYEDLILHKEREAEKLGEFLSIKITTDISELKYGVDMKYTDNSSFGDVRTLFDPNAVYRWKDQPDDTGVLLANHVCAKEIKEFDYPSIDQVDKIRERQVVKDYRKYHRKTRIRRYLKRFLSPIIG